MIDPDQFEEKEEDMKLGVFIAAALVGWIVVAALYVIVVYWP